MLWSILLLLMIRLPQFFDPAGSLSAAKVQGTQLPAVSVTPDLVGDGGTGIDPDG